MTFLPLPELVKFHKEVGVEVVEVFDAWLPLRDVEEVTFGNSGREQFQGHVGYVDAHYGKRVPGKAGASPGNLLSSGRMGKPFLTQQLNLAFVLLLFLVCQEVISNTVPVKLDEKSWGHISHDHEANQGKGENQWKQATFSHNSKNIFT